MFSSFLQPQGRQSRSKSPSARQSRESNDRYSTTDDEYADRYRRTAGPKYSETDSDGEDVPETPRYEERTPAAYGPPSKDDRRRPKRPDEREVENKYKPVPSRNKTYSDSPSDDERAARRSRRERRDVYPDEPETPRPRMNGTSASNGYPAYPPNGNVPGAFPGQTVPPQVSAYPQAYPSQGQYASVGNYQYANPDPNAIQYNYNNDNNNQGPQPVYSKAYDTINAQPVKPSAPAAATRERQYYDDKHRPREDARVRYQREEDESSERTSPRPGETRQRRDSYHRERSRSPNPAVSPGRNVDHLRQSLGRLSTGGTGARLGVAQTPNVGGRPPASPLLEAYKGTYQTISPMPSPLALVPAKHDNDPSDLDLSSDEEKDELRRRIRQLEREKKGLQRQSKLPTQDLNSPRSSDPKLQVAKTKGRAGFDASTATSRPRKKVSFYDPLEDAEKIAEALKGTHREADFKPLLKILPWLTTDEMILLKGAYKNVAKINGQGINLSKHIKARIPKTLGKCLYATSLGQYESDAYWANCFYQSGASRRELLIESLVGRSNQQIREIKDVFKDKRYDDDLEKCMKAELKADKFRTAILLALEERRMPEGQVLDMRLVRDDAEDLHEALNSAGGETAMIKIILVRSDDHLKQVLRYYEKAYKRNFAKDMIRKSQNLVVSTLPSYLNHFH